MEQDTLRRALLEEVRELINKRRKYESWDFKLSHILIWVSILASFISSILIANGVMKNCELCISVISGVPGIIVIIDKTFDFTSRAGWATMYKIDLEELEDKINHGKIDLFEASKELRELKRKHETLYMKIGFFARGNNSNSGSSVETEDGSGK